MLYTHREGVKVKALQETHVLNVFFSSPSSEKFRERQCTYVNNNNCTIYLYCYTRIIIFYYTPV